MEFFAKIVNGEKLLSIFFQKITIIDIWQGPNNASTYREQSGRNSIFTFTGDHLGYYLPKDVVNPRQK